MNLGIRAGRRIALYLWWLRDLLQRRTSSLAFIPQVDGLRFYAIFAVLIFHCTAYLMAPEKTRRQPRSPRAGSLTFRGRGIQASNCFL